MTESYEQDFPSLQTAEMRLALLIVDAVLAGNSRLLPDSEACTCGVGDDVDVVVDGKVRVAVHKPGCAGGPEMSPALRPPEPVVEWPERYRDELVAHPVLRRLLTVDRRNGVDAVYDWAGLKPAEGDAVAMHHAGFRLGEIAERLQREDSAVRQLIKNGVWRLERMLRLSGGVTGAPHCEICLEAGQVLRGIRRQAM